MKGAQAPFLCHVTKIFDNSTAAKACTKPGKNLGLAPVNVNNKRNCCGYHVKYLVSGATGFIGRELCRQLTNNNVSYTALSRGGASLPDGTATTSVDFSSREIDPQLLRGVDVVFHLAGIAHQSAQPSAHIQVNHLATLALAKASAVAGVKCFIYLSSVKAMGAPDDDAVRTEGDCTLPTNTYGLSKLAAERDLQSEFFNSEMSIVILRPTLVYGAGVKGNLQSMRRAVRGGIPRPPELGGRSMIAVQDLAGVMLQIAIEPPPGINLWIVCDGHSYSARRIYDLMRAASGRAAGSSYLPLWIWKIGAYLADGMRDRGSDSRFNKLFGTELYSSTAIMRDLSWQPQFELADVAPEIMAVPEEGSQ